MTETKSRVAPFAPGAEEILLRPGKPPSWAEDGDESVQTAARIVGVFEAGSLEYSDSSYPANFPIIGEAWLCGPQPLAMDMCGPAVPKLVADLAPLVRLHPAEAAFPMAPAKFAQRSSLKYARPEDCEDTMIASAVIPIRLGNWYSGQYAAQSDMDPVSCLAFGGVHHSNELSRPGDDSAPRSLPPDEGFYLDLPDSLYAGSVPDVDDQVHEPASYSFRSGEFITYWFMYAWNPGSPGLGGLGALVDRHEGEWERVTVRLHPDGTPYRVDYYAHECSSPQEVDWADVPRVDGHPVVYSALGAHASYPDVRSVGLDGLCSLSPWQDVALRVRAGHGAPALRPPSRRPRRAGCGRHDR